SRHYMPLTVLEKGREKTALVFDTWAQINEGKLVVQWNIEVTYEEQALLAQLAENLGYLGRAESWTVAHIGLEEETNKAAHERPSPNAFPCVTGRHPGSGWEQIALLAPISLSDYAAWRDNAVSDAFGRLPEIDRSKKKFTRSEQKKIDAVQNSY